MRFKSFFRFVLLLIIAITTSNAYTIGIGAKNPLYPFLCIYSAFAPPIPKVVLIPIPE